ncbi:hypothetical protein U9M48_034922 [Paspalum notatum var. saurae]|uniref:Uncharacterized protein n=1 Tax=Paspalum notatum var. saurae TaxID=547442 RepID=A0AAQ3UAN0_PASNO
MSSADAEEAGHKAPVLGAPGPGAGALRHARLLLHQGEGVVRGLLRPPRVLGQRLRAISRAYQACFAGDYSAAHCMTTGELLAAAALYAHLLAADDALPWRATLGRVRLTEDCTTSSSRIFLKLMFQALAEELGVQMLARILGRSMAKAPRCETRSSPETALKTGALPSISSRALA